MVIVTVTVLTDPDPVPATQTSNFEVKDEYDFTWKSSIEPKNENTSRNTKTTS